MKAHLTVALLAGMLAVGSANSQENNRRLDVPFVSTPQPVVEIMLDMVDLRDGDVVWDLGCGDGRMVITAAKRKNVRGVGVDIDPKRIEESKANGREAGVSERVTFKVADLFKTDFRDATVLTMYLLQRVNLKLRPMILNDLIPGARIVSNSFTMGEWEADAIQTAGEEGLTRTIYHWVVPANVSGEWEWKTDGKKCLVRIYQKFQTFSGTALIEGENFPFKDGKIKGKEITFTVKIPGRGMKSYIATADGDTLTGMIDKKPWKASRKEGTKVLLDLNGSATARAR